MLKTIHWSRSNVIFHLEIILDIIREDLIHFVGQVTVDNIAMRIDTRITILMTVDEIGDPGQSVLVVRQVRTVNLTNKSGSAKYMS